VESTSSYPHSANCGLPRKTWEKTSLWLIFVFVYFHLNTIISHLFKGAAEETEAIAIRFIEDESGMLKLDDSAGEKLVL
jgi:hypothetical protein